MSPITQTPPAIDQAVQEQITTEEIAAGLEIALLEAPKEATFDHVTYTAYHSRTQQAQDAGFEAVQNLVAFGHNICKLLWTLLTIIGFIAVAFAAQLVSAGISILFIPVPLADAVAFANNLVAATNLATLLGGQIGVTIGHMLYGALLTRNTPVKGFFVSPNINIITNIVLWDALAVGLRMSDENCADVAKWLVIAVTVVSVMARSLFLTGVQLGQELLTSRLPLAVLPQDKREEVLQSDRLIALENVTFFTVPKSAT